MKRVNEITDGEAVGGSLPAFMQVSADSAMPAWSLLSIDNSTKGALHLTVHVLAQRCTAISRGFGSKWFCLPLPAGKGVDAALDGVGVEFAAHVVVKMKQGGRLVPYGALGGLTMSVRPPALCCIRF